MAKRLLSTADGESDAAGNIVIETGSSEDKRLRSKGLKPDEFAARVVFEVIMNGGSLADALETAMGETPDDPPAIAKQIQDYFYGFYNVAKAEAKEAIDRKDEDED